MKRLGEDRTELYKHYCQVVTKLIDDLAAVNMLNFEYNAAIRKLAEYANNRANLINKLEEVVKNPPINAGGLTKLDFMKLYVDMIIYLLIIDYGLLENVLLSFVQQKKRYNNVTISGEETLTKLLQALEKIIPNNGLKSLVNTNLRNALTHFWYWVEGEHFCYCDNPWFSNPVKLEPFELLTEFQKLNLLTKCVIEEGRARIRKIKAKTE